MEEGIDFQVTPTSSNIIKIIGVGGAGGNAVRNMYEMGIVGVDYVICNTDLQALNENPIPVKVQIGKTLTSGLGAGNNPKRGRESAIEDLDEIKGILSNNTRMAFVAAGMGGGTGTGAAPIIAQAAKDMGILTIGIVSLPYKCEGKPRLKQAIRGALEMSKSVDSLLVVNSERLVDLYGNMTQRESMRKADSVLAIAAKGLAEMITLHGIVNVDFADVKTALEDSGCSLMGMGVCSGENRAHEAIKQAITSPLLNNNDIRGAQHVLVNIATSSEHELLQSEQNIILNELYELVGGDANEDNTIIWGIGIDDSLGEDLRLTVVVAGFTTDVFENSSNPAKEQGVVIELGNLDGVHVKEPDESPVVVSLPDADGRNVDEIAGKIYGSKSNKIDNKVYSTSELKPATVVALDSLTDSVVDNILDNPAYERRKVS